MEKNSKIKKLRKTRKVQNLDTSTSRPFQDFSFTDIKNTVKNLSDLGYTDVDILIYLAEQFKDKEKIIKMLNELRSMGDF